MQSALQSTTPDQRHPLYRDVETLIAPGFLSQHVTVNDVPLALRSLFPGDIYLLQARVGNGGDSEWKNWAIASSIWLVQGYMVSDPNLVPRLYRMIKALPKRARDRLFSIVVSMFDRQGKALEATESYCYETFSRYQWRTYGGHNPTDHMGISGLEKLGTNHIQRMWTFYNSVEDQRIQDDRMWEGFKLSISPHTKGVKKIDQKDIQQRREELARRQEVQDKFFYTATGVLEIGPKGEVKDAPPGMAVKSVEDLEQEMYRWVTGQEDQHDEIVRAYKERISRKHQAAKEERERRAAMMREEYDDNAVLASTALVGYTADQLREVLKGRKTGVKSVLPGGGGVRDYLYEKYIERPADAGLLKAENGQLKAGGGKNLTPHLDGRQVPFQVDDSGSEE